MSHTPAPWIESAPNIEGIVDQNYRRIAGGCGFTPDDDEPDLQGFQLTGFIRPEDARLIAAAPELLGALKALALQTSDWTAEEIRKNGMETTLNMMRTAIAKAEGQS